MENKEEIINAVYQAGQLVADEARTMVYVEGHYVDSPSNKFNFDEKGNITSVNTDVYNEYPVEDTQLILNLNGLDKRGIVKYLSQLTFQLTFQLDNKEDK